MLSSQEWAALLPPEAQTRLAERVEMLTALELAGGGAEPVILVRETPEVWDGIVEARGTILVRGADVTGLDEAGFNGPRQELGDTLVAGPTLGPSLLKSLPLHGLSLVVTREATQAEGLVKQLAGLGASVVRCPVLEFGPPDDEAPLADCLEELGSYDWILFTSANGVDAFLKALRASGRDLRALSQAWIGAIGPGTARALGAWHLNADLIPEKYVAEGFLLALQEQAPGRRFLIPRAQEAREVLPDGLRLAGGEVDVVPVYRTGIPAVSSDVIAQAKAADWVLLASSSSARHYAQLVGVRPEQNVLAIGPITAQTALELGWTQLEVAEEYTLDGMLAVLLGLSS